MKGLKALGRRVYGRCHQQALLAANGVERLRESQRLGIGVFHPSEMVVQGGLPAAVYPVNMNTRLFYGPFNLADSALATVSFQLKNDLGSAGDRFQVLYSTDGLDYFGLFNASGGDFTWRREDVSLTSLVGQSSVILLFRMISDNIPNISRGVLLDEVRIEKLVGPPAADLALTLIDVPSGTYTRDQPISVRVIVENIGSATSVANSAIDYYASTNNIISTGDHYMGRCVGIPALPPESGADFSCPLQIPDRLPNGTYHIGGILGISDLDSTNNTNYDTSKITVFSAPDIRVRPLSLDFIEQAASLEADTAELAIGTQAGLEQVDRIMPSLLQKVDSDGFVNVIVGLRGRFEPEGRLEMADRNQQRTTIRENGNQLIAELRKYGAEIKYQYRSVPYIAMQVNARALANLQQSALVVSIVEDKARSPLLATSNAVIGSPLAWAEGYDGAGWAVAVLDTGVDKLHPWFTIGGNTVVSEACYSTNLAGSFESLCPGGVPSSTASNSGIQCETGVDGCGHGTHVAGIVAGNRNSGVNFGVARGAEIISIQVMSKGLTEARCGEGKPVPCTRALDSDITAALERVLALSDTMDIAAINMSLGGGEYADQASCDLNGGPMKAVIANLRAVDIATVIASGNDSFSDAIGFPGCISNAISVGATDDADNVAGFSNIYPQLHLLAPGVDIDSSLPGNVVESNQGTSMAAPHVAGAWAVLKQANPNATVDNILTALQTTGTLVDDLRPARIGPYGAEPAGIETDIPRINVDLALGGPRTAFGIFNDGPGLLTVTSIVRETAAPWVTFSPATPFSIEAGEVKAVSVFVNYDSAPEGASQVRLIINSNDSNENPYPGGVLIKVTKLPPSAPEFDSSPGGGATIDFGTTQIGNSSSEKVVTVANLGTADLSIACGLSGAHADDFTISACTTPVAPSGIMDISLFCEPTAPGAGVATLNVVTNDADEANVSYTLNCNAIEKPVGNDIFANGFETTP